MQTATGLGEEVTIQALLNFQITFQIKQVIQFYAHLIPLPLFNDCSHNIV